MLKNSEKKFKVKKKLTNVFNTKKKLFHCLLIEFFCNVLVIFQHPNYVKIFFLNEFKRINFCFK